jgi:hypothetical protein
MKTKEGRSQHGAGDNGHRAKANQTTAAANSNAISAGPRDASAFARWWTEYQRKMRNPKPEPSAYSAVA